MLLFALWPLAGLAWALVGRQSRRYDTALWDASWRASVNHYARTLAAR